MISNFTIKLFEIKCCEEAHLKHERMSKLALLLKVLG